MVPTDIPFTRRLKAGSTEPEPRISTSRSPHLVLNSASIRSRFE
ncbi:hypothetical protein TNCV_1106041 [Trichonephila clavipes]|nr:hypothetical protein TNCV_1106041 [Trichonephila clavipes]